MRAAVAGGAGFLGSHLCDRLLQMGYEVLCFDNFLTGSTENIAHLDGNQQFKFVKHNIVEPILVDGPLDAVFNLASPASPIDYLKMPIETLDVESLGTKNCLNLAREKNARFLLAS